MHTLERRKRRYQRSDERLVRKRRERRMECRRLRKLKFAAWSRHLIQPRLHPGAVWPSAIKKTMPKELPHDKEKQNPIGGYVSRETPPSVALGETLLIPKTPTSCRRWLSTAPHAILNQNQTNPNQIKPNQTILTNSEPEIKRNAQAVHVTAAYHTNNNSRRATIGTCCNRYCLGPLRRQVHLEMMVR